MKCAYEGCEKEATRAKYCSIQCKNKNAVISFRKRMKLKAVEYMGGSCQCCGYDRYEGALQFHHLDPNEKDFGISANGRCRKWETIVEELKKCIMVCGNCHSEIHAGIRDIPC